MIFLTNPKRKGFFCKMRGRKCRVRRNNSRLRQRDTPTLGNRSIYHKNDENNADLLFFRPGTRQENKKESILSEYYQVKRDICRLKIAVRDDNQRVKELQEKIAKLEKSEIAFAHQFIPGESANQIYDERKKKEEIAKLQNQYDENMDKINYYTILYSDKKIIEFNNDVMKMRIESNNFSKEVREQQNRISEIMFEIERFKISDEYLQVNQQQQIIEEYQKALNKMVAKYNNLKTECQTLGADNDEVENSPLIQGLLSSLKEKKKRYKELKKSYKQLQIDQKEKFEQAQEDLDEKSRIHQINVDNLIMAYPIPDDATKETVCQWFADIASIEGLMFSPEDYTPRSVRIQFYSRDDAIRAVELKDGFQINDEILTVELEKPVTVKEPVQANKKSKSAPRKFERHPK